MNNKKEEGRGLFAKAAVISPIAIGAGLTYKNFSNISDLGQQVNSAFNSIKTNEPLQRINRFSKINPTIAQEVLNTPFFLEKLNKFRNTGLNPEHIRAALIRSAELSDPSGKILGILDKRLGQYSTGEDLMKDLSVISKENSSIHMRRTMSKFLSQMEMLEDNLKTGKSLTLESLTSKITRHHKRLSFDELTPKMRGELERLKEITGSEVSVFETSRGPKSPIKGSSLQVTVGKSQKLSQKLTFNIPRPLSQDIKNPLSRFVVRGNSQQTRYIAGHFSILEGNKAINPMTFEEFSLNRAIEDVISPNLNTNISERRARVLSSLHEQKMAEYLEQTPRIGGNIHQGLDEYNKIRSQIIRLFDPQGKPVSSLKQAELFQQGGLPIEGGTRLPIYPSSSAGQIAKGVVLTTDPREHIGGLVPESFPFDRGPLKGIRQEYSPSSTALDFMAQDQYNRQMRWMRSKAGTEVPILRTAFISSQLDAQLADAGVSQMGSFIFSKNAAPLLSQDKLTSFQVASDTISPEFKALLTEAGGPDRFIIDKMMPKGTYLGLDPEGNPIKLTEDTMIAQAEAFEKTGGKGDFLKITGTNTITPTDQFKAFGIKGMGTSHSQRYIDEVVGSVTSISKAGQVSAAVTMDELKKNKSLLYDQMFSATYEFMNANKNRGYKINGVGEAFLANPIETISRLRRSSSRSSSFDRTMIGHIKGLTRAGQFSSEQMGLTFGAIPEALGDEGMSALGTLSKEELKRIKAGVAIGGTKFRYGGEGGSGAGRMGSIEPRFFDFLQSPHFKRFNRKIGQDFKERMMVQYPERVLEEELLTKSLKTMIDPSKIPNAVSAESLLEQVKQGGVTGSEVFLDTPSGSIFIPSDQNLSSIASYQTPTGKTIDSPLTLAYQDLIESTAAYNKGDLTKETFDTRLSDLKKTVFESKIKTIVGKSGQSGSALLRGAIQGSENLTALPVSKDLGLKLKSGEAGITANTAENMFRQMKKTGLYNPELIDDMRKSFLSGEGISGFTLRHPATGPHSLQATTFRLALGDSPSIYMPEEFRQVAITNRRLAGEELKSFGIGARNTFSSSPETGRRMAELAKMQGIEILDSPLSLGKWGGMAADADGDTVVAILASPHLQQDIQQFVADPVQQKAYEDYTLRRQILTAKAPKGTTISEAVAMGGAAIKTAIPQEGLLGRVSLGLQKHRRNILSGATNLTDQETYNALGFLDWAEQVPISGKHIATGEETKMVTLLENMANALENPSAEGIGTLSRDILSSSKETRQAALEEGFSAAIFNPSTKQMETRFIEGINLNQALQTLGKANAASQEAQIGGLSAQRVAEIIKNPKQVTEDEIQRFLTTEASSLNTAGSFSTRIPIQRSFGAKLSEEALAMSNRLQKVAKSFLPHAKPGLIGLGLGLGAAILSSPPSEHLRPEIPDPRSLPKGNSGGAGLRMDTGRLEQSSVSGQPSAPKHIETTSNRPRIAGPKQQRSYNVNVQGNTDGIISSRKIASQLNSSFGGNSRTNYQMRDDRTKMTPQKISELIS